MGIYAAIWDIILAEFAFFAALFCPALAWWSVRRARAGRAECGTKLPLARGIALGAALALAFTAFAELAVRPLWIRHHRRRQVVGFIETLESSEDVLDRRWAASMIWNHARTGDARRAVPALVRSLADPDPGVRATACAALKELRAREALSEIRKLLRDDDERVRSSAAAVIDALEPPPGEADCTPTEQGRGGAGADE